MPRYFFHTAGGLCFRDTQGTVLLDRTEARTEAIRFLGELLADQPDILHDDDGLRVEVTDDRHLLVFAITTLWGNAPAAWR